MLASPRPPARGGRFASGLRNHHFGRLDNRQCIVAATEFQRADGVRRDHGRERLIANTQANLGEEAIDPDLVDEAAQAVPCAEALDGLIPRRWLAATLHLRLLARQKPLDLRLRDAMVAAFGARGSHLSGVDPSLERGVSDAELAGRGPDREETHQATIVGAVPE